ncbi:hypothetical protein HGRIS_000969 [Hohenbuehelia grisea]|uniref:SMP domain-containing protein n=1 Tax=Hohenbuehelia grisea TaxID=104357 RepID=A0ABR3IQB5_9AGAR
MSGQSKRTPMNSASSQRIQSTQARGGRDTGSGSFASRAQSAAATNANKGISPGGGGRTPVGGSAGGGAAKSPRK